MVRHAWPIRFDRLAESGRSQPLRVVVETEDGVEHEACLKCSGRPELGVEGLANELVASLLAADLGLPVCEPFLVDLTEAWIDTVPDEMLKHVLRTSSPIAFGSKIAGQQWKPWTTSDALTMGRATMALAILAFDAFIENDDRRVGNANCFVKADAFRIFDHELAFRLRQKLFPKPEPWKPGHLQRLIGGDGHIFGSKLAGTPIEVGPIRDRWRNLSDEALDCYRSEIPEEWNAATEAMDAALTHIRTVRDRIEECLTELQRVLQ